MNTNNIQKVNYQKILDKITDKIEKECAEGENRPALFLHACCAPCSSYVLEYLTKYFKITIFYYNPNITPETEYTKRVKELQRFIHEAGYEEDVTFVEGDYGRLAGKRTSLLSLLRTSYGRSREESCRDGSGLFFDNPFNQPAQKCPVD